jgi:DNA-directed RNA polymerases I, II, and III subunit RPABC2
MTVPNNNTKDMNEPKNNPEESDYSEDESEYDDENDVNEDENELDDAEDAEDEDGDKIEDDNDDESGNEEGGDEYDENKKSDKKHIKGSLTNDDVIEDDYLDDEINGAISDTDVNVNESEILNDDDEEEDEEDYRRFENYSVLDNLEEMHPEIRSANMDELKVLSKVVRDSTGKIVDPFHTTTPFLTKYEKARVIGTRAEQIERGAPSFIKDLNEQIIHGRTIALKEFERQLIPFIIARPMPNKGIEYWKLQDLEVL